VQNTYIQGSVEGHRIICEPEIPLAAKCLESALEACLTYLQFAVEKWIRLRTTHVIERLNKDFKRRTKSLEIVAGERPCHTLLAFVCLEMELTWRSKRLGGGLETGPSQKDCRKKISHNYVDISQRLLLDTTK
jgi:hypothetical protein